MTAPYRIAGVDTLPTAEARILELVLNGTPADPELIAKKLSKRPLPGAAGLVAHYLAEFRKRGLIA
jgi:hypothetical protein